MTLFHLLGRMFWDMWAAGPVTRKQTRAASFALEACDDARTGATALRRDATAIHAPPAIIVDLLESRTMLSVPNGPFGLSAAAVSSSSIRLAWYTNSNDELGFVIERNSGSGYQLAGTVGAGVTSWGDASLSPSTTYTYRVKAYSAGGDSGYSGEASATTQAGAVIPPPNTWSVPNGPFGTSASALSSSSIKITWYSNSNNELGFKIERNNGGGYVLAGTVGAGVTTFTDSGLSASSTYTYRVKAYNAAGDSGYSGEASATTQAGSVVPPPPSGNTWSVPNGPFGLSATAGASGIKLAWYSNSNNELGFKVDRSSAGGNWANIATVGTGVTSYTDSSAASGATYSYRVYAFNNGGSSGFAGPISATAQGTTPPPPPPPATGINFTPYGGWGSLPNTPFGIDHTPTKTTHVILIWHSNSNNEGGFLIQRRSPGGGYINLATVGPAVTTYTDYSTQPNAQYYYRVAAFNAAGLSNFTNEILVTAANPMAYINPATFFSIGTYLPATDTMDMWKSRGINTVWEYQLNQDWLNTWITTAQSKGFEIIRNARTNIAQDVDDPNLLAYLLEDEPDIHGISPDHLQAEYNALKAANPSVPVLINVSAANVISVLDSLPDSLYRQFSQAADWMSSDVYPLSTYSDPTYIDLLTYKSPYAPQWDRGPANPGNGVEVLRTLDGGKRQIAFVETSKQNPTSGLAPTPDEFRGEVWDSIVHGAKGICYFPLAFPSTSDGTPANVVTEMIKQNALMTQLGPIITSFNDSVPQEIAGLPKGIEGMWRYYNGHTYYFLLNMSHTPQWNMNITLPGVGSQTLTAVNEGRSIWASNGSFTDSFGAYGLHVYQT